VRLVEPFHFFGGVEWRCSFTYLPVFMNSFPGLANLASDVPNMGAVLRVLWGAVD
jgi:hypothetical protein